jgi:hypothetical protein
MTAKPTDAKPTRPKAATDSPAGVATLKSICTELKLDARVARETLRIAARDAKKFPDLAKAHKPRSAWEWPKGSQAEKEARAALTA